MIYKGCLKRVFDLIASFIGILFMLPIGVIISILILTTSKGPVFFKQIRLGCEFKPFILYKFRTMSITQFSNNLLITSGDDIRITSIGKYLRKAKLDEFPQLFNVLKGDMSLVGPRPEVEKFVQIARREYEMILTVKPGITDFAAIKFRDEETMLDSYADKEYGYIHDIFPRKIDLYKKYIREMCFSTDLKLILVTIFNLDIDL